MNDQKFVAADTIVNELLGDTYDDGGLLKEKFYRWVFRVWKDLNFDLIRTHRRMVIPISQHTKTAMLPADCQEVYFIGYIDECFNRRPLAFNKNLAPRLGIENALPDVCDKCGQVDLCKAFEVEEAFEDVYINNTKYVKTIKRAIKPDGTYREFITEPVADYTKNKSVPTVNMVESTRIVCDLSTTECGCVPDTEANLDALANCGCSAALCCCSNDNLPNYVNSSGIASYNLYAQDGFIQLSPDSCLSNLYIEYVSCGLCKGALAYFPTDAEECLIAGAYYRSIEKKRTGNGITDSEKNRARRAWQAEKKLLLRRHTRLSIEMLIDAFGAMPRIPSL